MATTLTSECNLLAVPFSAATRLYGLTLWLCRVLSSADNQRLTLTGCGLQRQQALLPRDRHPAPETQRLHPAPDKASL